MDTQLRSFVKQRMEASVAHVSTVNAATTRSMATVVEDTRLQVREAQLRHAAKARELRSVYADCVATESVAVQASATLCVAWGFGGRAVGLCVSPSTSTHAA